MKKLITISAVLAFAATATADDKKPEAKKPEAPAKDAAPKMEAPKPAPELAAMAKDMVGSWKCAGKASDGTNTMDFKDMSVKYSLDLEKFWIKGEMKGSIGPMKVTSIDYLTYDAGQKKWYRLAVDNHGGQEVVSSTDGKTWEGEMRMGASIKEKAVLETIKPGKEWKITAQMSMDGKKWMPGFEMTCKK
jgi:hypothetical protein